MEVQILSSRTKSLALLGSPWRIGDTHRLPDALEASCTCCIVDCKEGASSEAMSPSTAAYKIVSTNHFYNEPSL